VDIALEKCGIESGLAVDSLGISFGLVPV
jgi:hypothetical protein